ELRQVDGPDGELAEDLEQRPRPVLALEHDDRRLVVAGAGRDALADDHEAGLVVGVVLDVGGEDLEAVELGRQRGGDGRPGPAAAKASVSSVTLTEPSMAFSMGTTPRSARPWSTSVMTSEISRTGTRSPAARSGWDSRASSVNVPGGPRNATRGRGGWAGGDIA